MRIDVDEAFAVHELNEGGLAQANEIALQFDALLRFLSPRIGWGRFASLVRTKLEEACFYAKKGVASQEINQKLEYRACGTTSLLRGASGATSSGANDARYNPKSGPDF